MKESEYGTPHFPLSVFYMKPVLDILAAIVGGKNQSFILTNEAGVSAHCPLVLDRYGNLAVGLPSCLPVLHCGEDADVKSYRSFVRRFLEKLGTGQSIDLRFYLEHPCADLRPWLSEGFVYRQRLTSYIDLTDSEFSILNGMRKSYPSAIRKVERSYSVVHHLIGSQELEASIEQWISLYRLVTSRADSLPSESVEALTRSLLMLGVLKLFAIYEGEVLISGVVICANKNYSYYWQSATRPEYEGSSQFSHALLWAAIRQLKAAGVAKLEIGPILLGDDVDVSSEKERSISFFKAGLGGRVVPWISIHRAS